MGWVDRYEKSLFGDGDVDYARLAGHYQGLVGDIIAAVGHCRLVSLVDALDRLEEHKGKVWHDADVAMGAPVPYPAPVDDKALRRCYSPLCDKCGSHENVTAISQRGSNIWLCKRCAP